MHLIRTPSLAAALVSALALTACGETETAACGGDGIRADNAWLREAGEGAPMSAAYVELCNGADAADRLVSATYGGAKAAEIHVTAMGGDGVASMAPAAAGVELPPHETTALAPGGAHIMLIGLTQPIEAGETASITLEFEHAEPLTVSFEARSLADAAGQENH